MELKEKRSGVVVVIVAILAVVIVAAIVLIYCLDVFGTRGTFREGTTVNGVDVSGMTAAEAEEALQKAVDAYELTVTFADGTETCTGKELGLTVQEGDRLKQLLQEQQDAGAKGSASGSTGVELELTAEDLIQCQPEQLENLVDAMPERTSREDRTSRDACLYYDGDSETFAIEPETVGGAISADELEQAIAQAASQLEPELDAVKAGLYGGKTVRRADSEEMQSALKKAQDKLNLTLTYTYDIESEDIHGEEVIDRDLLTEWLYVEEDGVTVAVDGDRLQEYVEQMEARYSIKTADTAQFVTSIGTFVEVNAPVADKIVDTDALYQDIQDCIDRGYSGERAAPYGSTKAGVAGTTDLGGTYVEVDLDHQHLYLYVDNELIAEGDICSGSVADGCATPTGLYTIKSKDHDRYLRGANYCDWVNYFMPFHGNFGLHDSTWRSEEEYGGEVYLESGSHGCINMPLELAQTVDEHVEVGTYVILYGGQPNPAWGAQSVYGTSHYTKSVDSDSFALNAYTTGDGTLSYESSDSNVVTVDQNGWVTVTGPGTATITVTASHTANYARGTKEITVVVNDAG